MEITLPLWTAVPSKAFLLGSSTSHFWTSLAPATLASAPEAAKLVKRLHLQKSKHYVLLLNRSETPRQCRVQ